MKNREREISKRYAEGISTVALGKDYGISSAAVCKILERNGIKRRSNKEANGGLSSNDERQVCGRYIGGESTVALSKAYGVCTTTICKILERGTIPIRSIKEATGGLSEEEEKQVCVRYVEGESLTTLGKVYGVAPSTICRI